MTTEEWSADGVAANPRGCGFCSSMSSPDGASASLVVGRREENRFEGVLLATGRFAGRSCRHETDGSGPGRSGRQVLRADPDRCRVDRIVGQRVNGNRRRRRGPNATRPGNARAAGRFPGRALGETLDIVTFQRRKSPERQLSFGQRGNLCDVRDREAESVVVGGPHCHRNRDRDVERRDDEPEHGWLGFARFKVIDGSGAQEEVGIAFVVGTNLISPACDADWHCSRAKSWDVHSEIARGFPNTPSGVLNVTFRADSSTPGSEREKLVTMSGWPPTCVVDIVEVNESIGSLACAERRPEPSKQQARRRRTPSSAQAHSRYSDRPDSFLNLFLRALWCLRLTHRPWRRTDPARHPLACLVVRLPASPVIVLIGRGPGG